MKLLFWCCLLLLALVVNSFLYKKIKLEEQRAREKRR